ncbi:MAG: ABC transporter permease subunit [Candidatus Brocadiae bacterium]|nr:ABC transporter permease subunit [Candidatus Brocadiia bacterium]
MNPKLKTIAMRFVLYTLLTGGAVIVLLPLFWMILTACKQSGQALEFRFFPDAFVESEAKTIMSVQEGKSLATFEYDPRLHPSMPAATKVNLAGEMNGWNPNANSLVKEGMVWTITLPIAPGRYEYKFVINGSKWTPDQGNPPKDGGDCNSVIELKPGRCSNKILSDATELVGKELIFKIYRPQSNVLQAKVNKQAYPLEKDKDGYFHGRVLVQEEQPQYSILEPQTFWEGMKKIYTFSNFTKVLNNPEFPFSTFFLNSLIVAAGTALATVFLCTMAGYAFAKKEFFMKKQLFAILLSTMMIPGMIFMVPQFAIVNKFNWINTYQGMIVPHLANIFGLFLLRQYISTIPDSLFEAATIDGASELQIFKIIIIPLSLPIMVTLFLLTFVGQWGNFLWQLIVNTPDSVYRTLPVGLALFRGQYGQDWEMMMAGACFSILPIAILFLLAQRVFIEGMTSGSVKE